MNAAVLVLLGLAATVYGKELPSYVPICKGNAPDFSDCMKRATATIQPYLAKGIPELNIPAFEPLVIPMVKLEQGTGAVNYKADFNDIKVHGLSNYKFTQVMADFVNAKALLGKVDLPQVTIFADYSINGKVLVVPIKGDGQANFNLTNCNADVMLMAETVKRKGVEYLKVKDLKLKLYFGGATAHFDNLFNGDSALGMATNMFLNENAKDILEEIKPALEAVVSMLIEDVVNKVFRSTPADKLFPVI